MESNPYVAGSIASRDHETDALEAGLRFSAALRRAFHAGPHRLVRHTALVAVRAFGGESAQWGPLVCAVARLLSEGPAAGADAYARGQMRAFVAENVDLLAAHHSPRA